MNVGTLTISLTARTASLAKAGAQVKLFEKGVLSSVQRINASLASVGMAFGALTIPIAAVTAVTTKMFAGFEYSLAKIEGLVGVAGDKVQKWGDSILKIAPSLAKGPEELSEALFFVTSAGIRGAETMDVLKLSAKAATAGLGETAVAADAITSAMNAYGKENLSAAQATDALIMAIREGKVIPEDFAKSIGKVLPIAAQLNVSFKEVGAAMAAMTRTGTPASTSAIYLRRVLSTLLRPTNDAKKAMNDMGLSFASLRDDLEKDGGLLTVLMKIRGIVDEFGEEQAAEIFPNLRALIPVLDLIGKNFENTKKMWKNMMQPVGALDAAFGAAAKTLKVKWDSAMAKIDRSLIRFGSTLKDILIPLFNKVATYINNLVDKWNSLDSATRKSIVSATLLVGAIGPVLVLVQLLISPLLTLVGLFNSLAGSIFGLAAGLYILVDVFKQIRDVEEETPLANFMANVGTYFAVFLQKIKVLALKIAIVLYDIIGGVANGINRILEFFINSLTGSFTSFVNSFSNWFRDLYKMLPEKWRKAIGLLELPKLKIPEFKVADITTDSLLDKLAEAEETLKNLKDLRPGGNQSWNWADQLFGKNGTGQFDDALKQVSAKFVDNLKSDMDDFFVYMRKSFPKLAKMFDFFNSKNSKAADGFSFDTKFSTERKIASLWDRSKPNTSKFSQEIKGISQPLSLLLSSMKGVNDEFKLFGSLSDVGANRLEKLKQAIERIKEITAGNDGYILNEKDKNQIKDIKEQIRQLDTINDVKSQLDDFLSFMSTDFKEGVLKALYSTEGAITKWSARALTVLSALAGELAGFTSELFAGIGAAIAGSDNPFDSLVDMLLSTIKQIGKTLLTVGILLLPFLPMLGAELMLGGAGLSILAGYATEKKGTKMANGGIIPSGYEGDKFPAMLNSGEAVIPLDRLPQLIGMNSNGNKRVEFIIEGRVLKGILADANAVSNAY